MAFPESLDLQVGFNVGQRKACLLTELQKREEQGRIADQEERRKQLAEARLGEPAVFVQGVGYIAASASTETSPIEAETP